MRIAYFFAFLFILSVSILHSVQDRNTNQRNIASNYNSEQNCKDAISGFINQEFLADFQLQLNQIDTYLDKISRENGPSEIVAIKVYQDQAIQFRTHDGEYKISLKDSPLEERKNLRLAFDGSRYLDMEEKDLEKNLSWKQLFHGHEEIIKRIHRAHELNEYELESYLINQYNKIQRLIKFYDGELDHLPIAELSDNSLNIFSPSLQRADGKKANFIFHDQSETYQNVIFDLTHLSQEEFTTKKLFANFLYSLNYIPNFFSNKLSQRTLRSSTFLKDNNILGSFHIIQPTGDEAFKESKLLKSVRSFLFNEYKNRLNLEQEDITKLQTITKDLEDRTIVVASARKGQKNYQVKEISDDTGSPLRYLESPLNSDIEVSGTISIVVSKSEEERTPLELFTGYDIPRKDGEMIAEIGRFTVDKEASEFDANDLIAAITMSANKIEGLDRIVIEADRIRARSFKRWGFKPIHERINYEGKTEYIMEVTPRELNEKVNERFFELIE